VVVFSHPIEPYLNVGKTIKMALKFPFHSSHKFPELGEFIFFNVYFYISLREKNYLKIFGIK